MGADRESLQSVVQVLNGFRPGTLAGRYVVVHRSVSRHWAIAQLTTDADLPLDYLAGEEYPTEAAALAAVERLQSTSPSFGQAL
jgi:hypothetical protein